MCYMEDFSLSEVGLNPGDRVRIVARSRTTSGQNNPTCGILHGFRLSGMLRRSNRDAIEPDVGSCQGTRSASESCASLLGGRRERWSLSRKAARDQHYAHQHRILECSRGGHQATTPGAQVAPAAGAQALLPDLLGLLSRRVGRLPLHLRYGTVSVSTVWGFAGMGTTSGGEYLGHRRVVWARSVGVPTLWRRDAQASGDHPVPRPCPGV